MSRLLNVDSSVLTDFIFKLYYNVSLENIKKLTRKCSLLVATTTYVGVAFPY